MFNIPAPNLCFAQNSFAVSHAVNFPWLKQTLDFENSRKLFSGHLGHTPGCGWRDKFYCGAIKIQNGLPPVYENLFGTPQHLWRPIGRSVWPDSNRCVSVPFVSCSCTSPHFSNAKIHSSLCLQDNNADRAFDGAFLSGYSVSVRCNFAIAQKTVLPDSAYRCGPDFDNYSAFFPFRPHTLKYRFAPGRKNRQANSPSCAACPARNSAA